MNMNPNDAIDRYFEAASAHSCGMGKPPTDEQLAEAIRAWETLKTESEENDQP